MEEGTSWFEANFFPRGVPIAWKQTDIKIFIFIYLFILSGQQAITQSLTNQEKEKDHLWKIWSWSKSSGMI